jgi:hypothetical protein
VLAAALAAGCGREALPPLAGWGDDLAAAKAEAAASKRPLAILFSAPWSNLAGKFEKQALADAAVRKHLERFVRVRVNLEKDRSLETEYAVPGVPCLVLLSRADDEKKAERKSIPGSCSAAELADFLATLGDWQPLDGWASDYAQAQSAEKASGKPLAVLYSAAWEPSAVAFEKETLGDEQVKAALSAYTLLRLNLAADAERAERDAKEAGLGGREKLDKIETAPVLLLPGPSGPPGKWLAVPEKCPASAVLSLIGSLSGWKESPGWTSDSAAIERARAEKKPVALVLDSASDWPSAKLVHVILEQEKVLKELKPFVKVRLEYGKVGEQNRKKWQASASPCLILLSAEGRDPSVYGMKGTTKELAAKIAEGLKRAAEPKGS